MAILLAATPQQCQVIASRARFVSHIAGRRCGKTIGVCRPRIIHRCLGTAGMRYTYIAPSYSQLWEEYTSMRGHEGLAGHIKSHRDQPYPHIVFASGSQVGYRSFERPDNIRSKGEDEVWCDEIQEFSEREFWPIIRPLISDRRGSLGVSGQLRGRNWIWQQFVMPGLLARADAAGAKTVQDAVAWINGEAYDGIHVVTEEDAEKAQKVTRKAKQGTYATWVVPSWRGLMFQDEAGQQEIALAKSQLPRAVFDQEYGCIPTANQASVFRAEDLEAASRGEMHDRAWPSCRYVIGLDLGRIKDPTSAVVLEASGRVVAERVFPLLSRHEDNAREVRRMVDLYGGAACICDTTGGATGGHLPSDEFTKVYQTAIQNLRRFTWTQKTKREIIEGLAIALEQHKLTIPGEARETHAQMAAYEYRSRGLDSIEYGAPPGQHDDLVAALAMAWYAKCRGWFSGTTGDPLGSVL